MKPALTLIAAAALLASGYSFVFAQGRPRAVEQFTCKDVMREHGADRDVAIAFLHGFMLGKSGGSNFELDTLRKRSNDFIERCLDNPGERALDAMTNVKG